MDSAFDNLLFSPDTFGNTALYHKMFDQLRRDDPVHWAAPDSFRPFWAITRCQDIREIEQKQELFINAPRILLARSADEEQIKAVTGGRVDFFETLLHMDGLHHRAHRAIAQAWFMPNAVKKLEQSVALVAREFVDRLELAGGQADFCKTVSTPYPLRVVMTLMGVPAEDEALMLRYTHMLTSPSDYELRGERTVGELRREASEGFFDYFRKLLAERRREPKDDLTTAIALARVDGEPVSEMVGLSYCLTIAVAGHDTTSNTTSGGLLALMQNPEQLALLRADRSLLPRAVEEFLRWVCPVKHMLRTASQDYVLRGKTIRAGDSVMLCFPSGNRDEEMFPDPHRFDITRSPNQHLSFGSGVHTCLGLHLSKMEMRALFTELLDRLDHIELNGPTTHSRGFTTIGLRSLPIRYTMATAKVTN